MTLRIQWNNKKIKHKWNKIKVKKDKHEDENKNHVQVEFRIQSKWK